MHLGRDWKVLGLSKEGAGPSGQAWWGSAGWAEKVPAGRGLIAEPSGSSPDSRFWGAGHTTAGQAHDLLAIDRCDAGHAALLPGWSWEARSVSLCLLVTAVTTHLTDVSLTTSKVSKNMKINLKRVTAVGVDRICPTCGRHSIDASGMNSEGSERLPQTVRNSPKRAAMGTSGFGSRAGRACVGEA